MPTTVNLGGARQLGTYLVRSVTYRAYASVSDQSTEVPLNQAHYLLIRMFSANNGSGPDFGQASIDLGPSQTVMEYSRKATLDEAIQEFFPPPGTDA